MRALLVDDDPNIRSIVRRVLTRQFESLEIVDCTDGVQALEQLSQAEYDLVLLDVSMPFMDGLDVLQSIRRSPVVGKIPVIMMTGNNEEHTIRSAVQIGVNDFILKPIHPIQLCERVLKLLTRSSRGDEKRGQVRQGFRPLSLNSTTTVLLADGSNEFRQFFRTVVSSLCPVQDVASGLAAFQHCLESTPYALFVGSDLGIVSGEVLARKLQALPRLCSVRLVGIETERSLLQVRKRGTYEAVILRSFVEDVFMEGVQSLLRKPASRSGDLAGAPDLKLLAISAAEESFSSALGQHVVLRPQSNRMTQPLSASMMLHVGVDNTPLTIRLSIPANGADRLAAKMGGAQARSDGNSIDAALMSLVERLSHGIADELRARDLTVASDAPTMVHQAPRKSSSAQEAEPALSLEFDVPSEKVCLRVSLLVGAVVPQRRSQRDANYARHNG
jgi:CheY-like chemotaxis protein